MKQGRFQFNRRWDSEVFVLEAESRGSLARRAEEMAGWCVGRGAITLKDLAYSANAELAMRPHRLAIVAESAEDLGQKLRYAAGRLADAACSRIKEMSGIYYFEEPLGRHGRVAFLFPGEGSQYPNMLADLCIHFPEVRACFDLLDRALQGQADGDPPSQFIFPPPGYSGRSGRSGNRLWRMDGAVEAVFTANRALLMLLDRLGVAPQVVLGHSTGEYSALVASGAVRIEDEENLMRHLREGNRLSERLLAEGRIPEGALLAVGAGDERIVSSVIESLKESVWLAMDNCPHQLVLCGSERAIAEAGDRLRQAGAVCNRLPFNRAYHTPLFGPVRTDLEKFFQELRIESPRIVIYSCATAQPYPTEPKRIREVLLDQWTSRVRFREAIENMYTDGVRVFIEVGPRGNLTAFVTDILRGRPYVAMAANVPSRSGLTQLNHLVARLAAEGFPIRLEQLYARRALQRVSFHEDARPGRSTSITKLALALPVMTFNETAQPTPRPVSPLLARASKPLLVGTTPGVPPVLDGPYGPDRGGSSDGSPVVLSVKDPQAPFVPSRPSLSHSAVMHEYLQGMERFLETQEVVLKSFLGQRATAMPVPQQGVRTGEVQRPQKPPIPGSVLYDNPPDVPLPAAPNSPATSGGSWTVETVRDVLLEIVTEKTGYPRDMLDLAAGLDADLGIDSIKRVEILGTFQRHTGLLAGEDTDSVSRLKTLQHIIDFVWSRQTSKPGGVQGASGGAARNEVPAQPKLEGVVQLRTDMHADGPFVGAVVSMVPNRAIRTIREFSLHEDVFLRDHALGGSVSAFDKELCALVVLPLTLSIEVLAQVASLLVPGRSVISIREVRAHRWIAFEESRVTLEISAQVSPGSPLEVDAYMTERSEKGPGTPAVEATIVFGDRLNSDAAAPFELREERSSRWTAERLYSEGMFHGPTFRGVVSVDRSGDDGIQATLRVPSTEGSCRIPIDRSFLVSPLLLDAAGQLVGYWTSDRLSKGYVVFPFRIKCIDFYGSSPIAGELFTGRARTALDQDTLVTADIEVVDAEDTVRARLTGWKDKRIDMPEAFFRFRIDPLRTIMSVAWPSVLAAVPVGCGLTCYQFELDESFLDADGGIWSSVLAHLILSQTERGTWRAMAGTPGRRRRQWLLGRAVAKDAVRTFVRERSGVALYPADIEIVTDDHGKPQIRGQWIDQTVVTPLVSIAHIDSLAVAVVGDASRYVGLGVDIERRGRTRPGFDQVVFTDDERLVASAGGADGNDEWNLRLWCAKEAIGKALGLGLLGGPASLRICGIDVAAGTVELRVDGALAQKLPAAVGCRFTAYTLCDGDFVTAISWRGQNEF
jgi:malonyl CoA-acyl carrier protein transacylase/phosphopantetheinyl transferase (holo-ACP synthase)